MKLKPSYCTLLYVAYMLTALVSFTSAQSTCTYYVNSFSGSDTNSGLSTSLSLKTITQAQENVRTVNTNMTGDIYVCLAPGMYVQASTLTFGPADSGTNGHYIHYTAMSGGPVEISGGQTITGWTPISGHPYYVASVPSTFPQNAYFRQIYVNGRRATLAGQQTAMQGISQIVNSSGNVQGINFSSSLMKATYHNLTDVRLVHVEGFKADYLPITSLAVSGSQVSVYTQQPYTQIRGSRGYFDPDSSWYIQNDFEDLSQPGQWYLDQTARLVYYYPRAGESLTGDNPATVIAPVVEQVMLLQGNTSQVSNLSFEGLTFEYGNWVFPQTQFIGGTQAEALFPSGLPPDTTTYDYTFQMPGEVTLNQTNNIRFLGDVFRHSADCGLDIYNGANNTLAQGNLVYDTTGAGIKLGQLYSLYGFYKNNPWQMTNDIPYQSQNNNTTIANNLVSDTGNDFQQATGISLMNPLHVTVLHNTVYHTAYMGIHSRATDVGPANSSYVGYTTISSNKTIDNNWSKIEDNGAIYSFGYNPYSSIDHNWMYDEESTYGTYADNDSLDLAVGSNVSAEKMFHINCGDIPSSQQQTITFQGNYTTASVASESCGSISTSNPDVQISYSNPWPSAAQNIINASGLQSTYGALINDVPPLSTLNSGLIYGQEPSADSGGWEGLGYLTDGSPLTNEASNTAASAWVQYTLPTPTTTFVLRFQTDFNGAYLTTAWKVQYYNDQNSTWNDLIAYKNITNSVPTVVNATSPVPVTFIRLYLENQQPGGRIGATEFTVNPTN